MKAWLFSGLALVIILGVIATSYLAGWIRLSGPAAPTTGPALTELDPLVSATDLSGSAWTASAEAPVGLPICLTATPDLPAADRTAARTLTSTDETLRHIVTTYADDAAATSAYSAWQTQLASCASTQARLTGASAVSGLADASQATQITVQAAAPEYHVVLLSRTGRTVSLAEQTGPKAPEPSDLATAIAKPLSRICSGGQGTCPTTPEVTATQLPPAEPAGWLIEADLPRVTADTGRWAGLEPTSSLQVMGSQCEAVILAEVSGTTSAQQRTLLLADDPQSSQSFGVDQVVYSFATAKAAASLADKLSDNIAACADRTPTATVTKGDSVKGTGAGDQRFTGTSFTVEQKVDAQTTIPFRVGVVLVGTRVTYLLANSHADFDFSDAQWKQILTRAALRVSQAS